MFYCIEFNSITFKEGLKYRKFEKNLILQQMLNESMETGRSVKFILFSKYFFGPQLRGNSLRCEGNKNTTFTCARRTPRHSYQRIITSSGAFEKEK